MTCLFLPCRTLVITAGLVATLPAAAVERYVGSAYAKDSQTLLYREVHLVNGTRQAVVFQCPDGKAFARKQLQSAGAATQPDFAFKDGRTGYEEGVRHDGASRVAYVREVDGTATTHALPAKPDAVIDAGFDAYVRAHWDDVSRSSVSVPFLVTRRGKFYPVKVAASESSEGMRRFSMKLDAWYGFATPTITLTYSEASRQLRRYEGPGTIRDAKGKPVDVRIEFPASERQGDGPAASFDAALALPLDGRCLSS